MIVSMLVVLVVLVVLYVTFYSLRGGSLAEYDQPVGDSFSSEDGESPEHKAVAKFIVLAQNKVANAPRSTRLSLGRDLMDSSVDGAVDCSFSSVNVDGLCAEWVVAPGTDCSRRLLYIHGGGFTMGSSKSHRNITRKFSEVANAAVLAIDYRLMPEHTRTQGISDCRAAYEWLISNGPDGKSGAHKILVAGDSAGGNLALALIAWVRDQGLRRADAVVALSPVTDSAMSSPSLRANLATDVVLGSALGGVLKIPVQLLWWLCWMQTRYKPNDPVISPIYGDLSDLPPTLVHASMSEMLYDDARRYVNKATASGSLAILQSWEHMMHVWHIYHPQLTEASDAWQEIEKFCKENTCKHSSENLTS